MVEYKTKEHDEKLVYFIKMKIFGLTILNLLLCVRVRAGLVDSVPIPPSSSSSSSSPSYTSGSLGGRCTNPLNEHIPRQLDNIALKVIGRGNVVSQVNLKRIKRVLANEHLPVWSLTGVIDSNFKDNTEGRELIRNHKVIKELGKFTFYQEPETSSAAVFFHKTRELNGMVAYEYQIRKLWIDLFYSSYVDSMDQYGIYYTPEYGNHMLKSLDISPDPESGLNIQQHLRTNEGRVYDGYPEVLVMISWEMAQSLTKDVKDSDRYTTIVSYVLTLFNGVDMLYSKLEKVKIQINIAGIIIGTQKESYLFLQKCYHTDNSETNENNKHKLEGCCVNAQLRAYLSSRRKKIPLQSYDVIMFLTEEHLYATKNENAANNIKTNFQSIDGVSDCVYDIYNFRSRNIEIILAASITSMSYMKSYPTIAHELAHLMTVKHDTLPYFTNDNKCCGNIMKTIGGWCDNCLSWSQITEVTLKFFYSSPNCCAFINEPRSLYPPGRQVILTADQQCQCHGYESAKKFKNIPSGFCQQSLQCMASNQFHSTAIPMDGTPCDENKVCWQKQCRKIQLFKTQL